MGGGDAGFFPRSFCLSGLSDSNFCVQHSGAACLQLAFKVQGQSHVVLPNWRKRRRRDGKNSSAKRVLERAAQNPAASREGHVTEIQISVFLNCHELFLHRGTASSAWPCCGHAPTLTSLAGDIGVLIPWLRNVTGDIFQPELLCVCTCILLGKMEREQASRRDPADLLGPVSPAYPLNLRNVLVVSTKSERSFQYAACEVGERPLHPRLLNQVSSVPRAHHLVHQRFPSTS